ncbi:glycoside hydrolase family 13 protein [Halomarina oriensis]|uniref:Alpha,alpha-phosphotrehalase n=1 Tax=Halomarina oriensis TaxID=671145 RepID=A0A6B0GN93_9EURY|nr:alpha-glucosidase [Halomarina oriensis]MWG36254.1 alpha,alpha-phosphotrehalase [Halomarina oriensis]
MTSSQSDLDRRWWKEAVVYQIYPQSFDDTTGDGIGDLQGILDRLDYLDELGVDVLWLNPVYDSPHHDDGYDVRDYRAIREAYGDMDDWNELLEAVHDRGMKLIMDLVVNHTSDEHAWFVEARETPDGEYRDYYVWREGETDADGNRGPPNNWESGFGGSAWEYDEPSGEYYLHLFDVHQPDLNWENPTVREEVYDMMRWWLEKGIDGFRMDVVNVLSKPQEFPDDDPNRGWVGMGHVSDGPRLDEFLGEMATETFDRHETMSVAEMPEATLEQARRLTGVDGPLDMVLHFEHVTLDYHDEDGWWTVRDIPLPEFKRVITRWQTGLDEGWNAVYLGNHDQPRIVSRFGDDDEFRYESATLLATLLLTLRGTPFLFQGDEIGMSNYPFESLEEMADAQTLGNVETAIAEGRIDDFEEVKELVRYRSRDNARTPMQWDDSEHAGFTDGDPWLPVNPNYAEVNVAAARADPDSVFHYYRRLVDLRHDEETLVYGEYDLLLPDHERVFAYTRTLGDDRWVVVLNVAAEPTRVDLPKVAAADFVVGNDGRPDDADERLDLRPYEARVYRG